VRPAVEVKPKVRVLTRDPPWDCAHTHIAIVRLGQLAIDIRAAADRLAADIAAGGKALERFRVAMEVLYPKEP